MHGERVFCELDLRIIPVREVRCETPIPLKGGGSDMSPYFQLSTSTPTNGHPTSAEIGFFLSALYALG